MELKEPRIKRFASGRHYLRITHEAQAGPLVRAEIVSPSGKVRHTAETLSDAILIARLCDRVYK